MYLNCVLFYNMVRQCSFFWDHLTYSLDAFPMSGLWRFNWPGSRVTHSNLSTPTPRTFTDGTVGGFQLKQMAIFNDFLALIVMLMLQDLFKIGSIASWTPVYAHKVGIIANTVNYSIIYIFVSGHTKSKSLMMSRNTNSPSFTPCDAQTSSTTDRTPSTLSICILSAIHLVTRLI